MKRIVWSILAACVAVSGCVERRITFTSDPPGALVVVSDYPVGRTPVTIPFTWYGDYDIIYRLKGYQTIKTHGQMNPPWYEVPPLDLLSHLAPWTYKDHRFYHEKMVKRTPSSNEDLIKRAIIMEKRNLEPVKH